MGQLLSEQLGDQQKTQSESRSECLGFHIPTNSSKKIGKRELKKFL